MKAIYVTLLAAAGLLINGAAQADEALAKAKNCMTCHQIATKVVGPAYKDVAKKYAGDKAAEGKLAEKIQKGGSGAWGTVPMPPNNVTPDEAKKLAHWVLSLK